MDVSQWMFHNKLKAKSALEITDYSMYAMSSLSGLQMSPEMIFTMPFSMKILTVFVRGFFCLFVCWGGMGLQCLQTCRQQYTPASVLVYPYMLKDADKHSKNECGK